MEAWYLAAWIVGFIIFVGLVVWLVNDIWEDYGPSGCLYAGVIFLFTIPIFPLLLVGYLILKHNYFGRRRPADVSGQERVSQWTWRMQQMEKEREGKALPYITAEESDEHIDLLLAEGKREAALQVAQELLETAHGFGDARGILRYSKYVNYKARRGRLMSTALILLAQG
jgi:hypothetical protein